MSTQLVLSTVGCLLAAATLPRRGRAVRECRYLRAAGQVQITVGFMDRTADLDSRKAALERNGILVLETSTPRTFTRTDREAATTSSPPFRSSLQSATAKAARRRSPTSESCWTERHWSMRRCRAAGAASIGSSSIPCRRFVTVSGHEGIVRYEGFESKRVVDEDWLAERARTVRELIRK
jgi:hypothetical protein